MKRALTIITGVTLLFIALSGCTTVRVSQDYKKNLTLTGINTYAWKNATQQQTGDIRIDNPFNDQRIRSAVDNALAAKGYRRASGSPDIFVSYNYSIQVKTTGSSGGPVIGFGFGMGGRRSAIGVATGVGSEATQSDQGILVIDIADGTTEELLWRGTSTATVDTQASPEKTTALFQKMVEKNLAQFPPDNKK
ncbi:hypothetical protein JCM14469_32720 [Desulfatiferula olefinivorans]